MTTPKHTDFTLLKRRLRSVGRSLSGALPTVDVANFLELLDAGEYGVALEDLCTQLHEYSIVLPAPIHHEIADLATTMGIDPHYWRILATDSDRASR